MNKTKQKIFLKKRFKAVLVLEGCAHTVTCTSRCKQSWKAAWISSRKMKSKEKKRPEWHQLQIRIWSGGRCAHAEPTCREGRLKVSLDSFSSCVWAPLSFPQCAFNSPQTQACLCLRMWGCRWTIQCWLWRSSNVPSARWCLHHLGVLITSSHGTQESPGLIQQCLSETAFKNIHRLYHSAEPFLYFLITLQLMENQ